MGKMIRLYTRQNDKTLRQLERDGRIINHRAYVEMHFGDIAPLFMESYDWFTKEAAKMRKMCMHRSGVPSAKITV